MSKLSDFIDSNNGIYSFIEKEAKSFRLDSVNDGVYRGSAFGLIESLDFQPSNIGSTYLSFKMPDGFTSIKDIKIKHIAVLNTNDVGTDIIFKTESWLINSGDTPDPLSPNHTVTSTISCQANHINTVEIISLPEIIIPSSLISELDKYIVMKFTRDATNVNDTYSGTFQLIAVQIYQI